MKHVAADEDINNVLSTVDIVIYGSFLEELSFPSILQKAMLLRKPVIAPDLLMIRKYVGIPTIYFLTTCLYVQSHMHVKADRLPTLAVN